MGGNGGRGGGVILGIAGSQSPCSSVILTDGKITSSEVSLNESRFSNIPQSFILTGVTRGGPPTIHLWKRDGLEIDFRKPEFRSSLVGRTLLMGNQYIDTIYVSTLVVTGIFPGTYQYSAKNRAWRDSIVDEYTIEGMYTSHYASALLQCSLLQLQVNK